MAETGLMMNSFSAMVLSGKAAAAYAGGICGYSGSATIQNTYTTGEISLNSFVIHAEPSVFAGGICGYNASGFVNGSAALCSGIHTNGASGRICAWSAPEQISDVYAYENMACSTKPLPEAEMGRTVSKQTVCDIRFFFAPAGDGGKLGWSNTRYDGTEAVWTSDVEGKGNYSLPLLNGVPRQNTFIMPDLK